MDALCWLDREAAAMEQRLCSIAPFAATIPMVEAAKPAQAALTRADHAVLVAKRSLRRGLLHFRQTLGMARRRGLRDERAVHRRFIELRMRMHALFASVDIVNDALTQRAEHGTGVLLKGLDELARDGLRLRDGLYEPPPIVCYLDQGIGGAIRRAFTRLPDGERNDVALIRIPRERLYGQGLASLLHEAGHQAVADLGLAFSYADELRRQGARGRMPVACAAWWAFKIRETLSDLWACAKLGVVGTLGLAGVLSLPPAVTLYDGARDVHPMPWLRVITSAAFGARILPHPLWQQVSRLWRSLYPLREARVASQRQAADIVASLPVAIEVLATLRPPGLRGMSLPEALQSSNVHPGKLLSTLPAYLAGWRRGQPATSPCHALASLGLARYVGAITPQEEYRLILHLLGCPGETSMQCNHR